MFILRTKTSTGHEQNVILGESYSVIDKEKTPEDFERSQKATGLIHTEGGNLYGFIVSDRGVAIHSLYKTNFNYIMTSNGETFANVSFKRPMPQ